PRRGDHPSLACGHCRRPARCRHCHGPLGRRGAGATPSCGWCGRPAVGAAPVGGASARGASARGTPARGTPTQVASAWDGLDRDARGDVPAAWECPSCSGTSLRSSVVGDRRTAEELGRAFPGVAVRTSGRDGVLDRVPAAPALVV
nr:hypothetical protein [Micromonospora sp. DSM 115978]